MGKKGLKIATFYESRLGRNDGPPLYWTVALRALGHEVIHLSGKSLPDPSKWGEFDLLLWVDWGEDALVPILGWEPVSLETWDKCPTAYVTSDTHLGFDYRLRKASEFDYVFCNQKRAVTEFLQSGLCKNVSWLPHAVDTQAYPAEPKGIEKYDVGFVGYVSNEKRAVLLDKVLREFPNFWFGQRLFEDAAMIYKQSRVVFNNAVIDDLNMRVFEVLACNGGVLVTEKVPQLDELFEDGVDCVFWEGDPVPKIREVLDMCYDKRRAIALSGYGKAINLHTYQNRAQQLIDTIF